MARWLAGGDDASSKPRLALGAAFLLALNVSAWCWAVWASRRSSSFLGIALVIYGLGLRHAVDADHIAAIDNATRKLMHAGQRPFLLGLWFAMGHSAIVTVVAVAIVSVSSVLAVYRRFQELGSTLSTAISAGFLFAIAAMNVAIFASLLRSYRHVKAGGTLDPSDVDRLLRGRGWTSRLLRPLFHLVTHSWQMFPLGVLLGLGFDTATEVAMYGLSASQVANGLPVQTTWVFPVLFAAGMSLVDTSDSVMMVGAYRWALDRPQRRLSYNLVITFVSIVVAVGIGGVEAVDLIAAKLSLTGGVWGMVGRFRGRFNDLGFAVVGVFVVAWALSYAAHRQRRTDDVDARIVRSVPS